MRSFAPIILAIAMLAGFVAWADEVQLNDYEFGCETPDGYLLKPKFGDIDGVFFTDMPAQRPQCLETIDRLIAQCQQNINFASNTDNEKYAGCLPIFERQASSCVNHFREERLKCDVAAAGQGAGETAEQPQEVSPADQYVIDPVDRMMEVAKRSNIRFGPGTDYDVLATLDAGAGVRVTGEVRGKEWVRVDVREDGGAAFIHTSLLKPLAPATEKEEKVIVSDLDSCTGKPDGATCWVEFEQNPGCHIFVNKHSGIHFFVSWSGTCSGGLATGRGTIRSRVEYADELVVMMEGTGAIELGKLQGTWIGRSWSTDVSRASTWEASYLDGKFHGRFIVRDPDGNVTVERNYVHGERK